MSEIDLFVEDVGHISGSNKGVSERTNLKQNVDQNAQRNRYYNSITYHFECSRFSKLSIAL